MKRIFAVILALLLCLAALPVSAEISLNDLSREELLALRGEINAELLKRGIEKEVRVPVGIYIIGEDIPAGVYSIAPEKYATITVYPDAQTTHFSYMETVSARNGEIIGRLPLDIGNRIEIEGGVLIFAPYQGLGF